MNIEQTLFFVGRGRQTGNAATFKIQGTGKLPSGRIGNYLINHKSFPTFHLHQSWINCLAKDGTNLQASFT
jgi:hypothetical protein